MLRSFLLSFIVTFSFAAWAHEPARHCDHQCQSDIHKITEEFHELLEGGEHHHYSLQESLKKLATRRGFVEWVRSFNLKKTALNAYRVYQVKSANPKIRDHVANLAFVFPLSHAIEMSSGPLLSALSAGAGWPDAVTGAFGVMGAIISVPGLDPVCLLIYATYPASRSLQNSLTFIRVKTVSMLHFAGTVTGVKKIWQPIRDWAQKRWSERALEALQITEEGVTVYVDPDFTQPVLHLSWQQTDQNYFYFSQVRFDPKLFDKLQESEWRRLTRSLPYNVRAAIAEARHALRGGELPFYVARTDINTLSVDWLPRSVQPDQALRTCRDLLLTNP